MWRRAGATRATRTGAPVFWRARREANLGDLEPGGRGAYRGRRVLDLGGNGFALFWASMIGFECDRRTPHTRNPGIILFRTPVPR